MDGNSDKHGILQTNSPAKNSPIGALLKHLNEYKELLGIVAVSAAVLSSIWQYFVMKSEFAEFACLTKYNIISAREAERLHEIQETISRNSNRMNDLEKIEKHQALSTYQRNNLEDIKASLMRAAKIEESSQNSFEDAEMRIHDGDCLAGAKKK
jgi:capsular polysaccharide biosynthesis protein